MKRHGFTLVEVSIVLVIIGLIIGGVLVGRELIRAADIRATISDIEKIKTTLNTFKLKYNCLAGDCPNATDYFTGSSNGNGDGSYLPWINDTIRAGAHLTAAELWPTHPTETTGFLPIKGIAGARSGVFYIFTNDLYGGGSGANAINSRYGNTITIAARNGGAFNKGVLTGEDAKQIDDKIDDGVPNRGRLFGQDATGSTCSASSLYDLTSTSFICRLLIYFE